MAILIGLNNEHTHGSFYGAEGFGGISMDATKLSIIKEGTEAELEDFVALRRAEGENAKIQLNELEDNLEYSNISQEDYDRRSDELIEAMRIIKFDKLLILNGKTL